MEKSAYPKYRWFVMFVMFFIVFVNQGIILTGPSPLVGVISKATGWQLGTVTAITMFPFTFFVAAGCVLGAFLLDKIGLGKTFIIAGCLSIAGAFLMPVLGGSIPGLLFLRFLEGLGAGLAMSAPAYVASKWFPLEERGIVTGVQGAGIGLGSVCGLNIAPAIYMQTQNWLITMTLLGIAPLIGLVFSTILKFGPNPPENLPDMKMADSDDKSGKDIFKQILKQPTFYIGIILCFAFSWVQQGYSDLTPGRLAVEPPTGIGLGAQTAGNIFSLYSLAFMIGALLSGFIGRYLFKNKLKLMIEIGFILAAIFNVSVLVPVVTENRAILIICLIFAGFFLSWCLATLLAFIAQKYPTNVVGRVGGLTQGIGCLGAPAGVAVGSVALGITERYTTAVVLCGFMCVLAFVLTFFLNKPKVSNASNS